jgi:ATPase family associated with various cellular activities (AAA)
MSTHTPPWASELEMAFRSGASGQCVLYGNVHDRVAVDGQLISIDRYLQDILLAQMTVVLTYDLGNGLSVMRGEEHLAQWLPSSLRNLPLEPLEAVRFINRYVRYLANLRAIQRHEIPSVAVILRGTDQLLPADGQGFQHGSLTCLVRDWGLSSPFTQLPFFSFLIADNLTDLDPLIVFAPQTKVVRIPLPSAGDLERALRVLHQEHPRTIPVDTNFPALAAAIIGLSVNTLQQITRIRAQTGQVLQSHDFAALKKEMVERDAPGLVEFVESTRTLDDYFGQDALKDWLRQDIALWRINDVTALPMGYLLCGPVGTGKTFLVECLAGEAGVPVLKLKNFRDKWIGSSEANLEKIFGLIHALGRCIVFVDEADQTLGRRDSGIADSGLSGRLYSMIAQEMANTDNRGKVVWVLGSSRPDLIEVDLKRPGRIDLKVPILPTATRAQSGGLIAALAKRYNLHVSTAEFDQMQHLFPTMLTPGAAEALVVKAYRVSRTEDVAPAAALSRCLVGYQSAIPQEVLEQQMRLAIHEASDLAFVAEELRHFANRGPVTE